MRKFTVRELSLAAVTAAIYTALTVLLPIPQYGEVQFRVAEALTVLPFLFPWAAPGLVVGCFMANLLGSPYPLDWVFGTLATALGCLGTAHAPNRWLAPLPPVIANAVVVGAEIAYTVAGFGRGFLPAFGAMALSVGAGELVVCYALGLALLSALPKIAPIRRLIPQK